MDKKHTCTNIFSIQVSGWKTQHTALKMYHASLRRVPATQATLAISSSNLCQLTSRAAAKHKHLLHSMGGGGALSSFHLSYLSDPEEASRLIKPQHCNAFFPDATHAFHTAKEMALAATKAIWLPGSVVQQRS